MDATVIMNCVLAESAFPWLPSPSAASGGIASPRSEELQLTFPARVCFPQVACLLKIGQPFSHVGYGNHRQGFPGVFQSLDDSRRLIFEVALDVLSVRRYSSDLPVSS